MTDEPEPEEDLEALDSALGALEEDGTDASTEKLNAAIEVFDGLDETAVETDKEGTDAHGLIEDTRDAMQRIADGDGSEEDVEQAEEGLTVVGQEMMKALLMASLGMA